MQQHQVYQIPSTTEATWQVGSKQPIKLLLELLASWPNSTTSKWKYKKENAKVTLSFIPKQLSPSLPRSKHHFPVCSSTYRYFSQSSLKNLVLDQLISPCWCCFLSFIPSWNWLRRYWHWNVYVKGGFQFFITNSSNFII